MPPKQLPYIVSDFIALPISLPPTKINNNTITATHYLYIKQYEPTFPTEESSRSLLLLNIPITATIPQIRHLLTTQLQGAHIQTIYFADSASPIQTSNLIAKTPEIPLTNTDTSTSTNLGKRKRPTQETSNQISTRLSTFSLPTHTPSQIHVSGSTAIATFLDRPSRDLTLKVIRRHAKTRSPLSWPTNLPDAPLTGLARYKSQAGSMFPPRADLLRAVDNFMTTYAELEVARGRESSRQRAEPDEDGFVTVTRGTRGVVKADEAEELKAKALEEKRKQEGLADFYRFQVRERRREEQGVLVRRFQDEMGKSREMGERRRGRVKQPLH